MFKKLLLITLLCSFIALPVCAKNHFKRQMPVVTGVPAEDPIKIDEEFASDFVYYDASQAKAELKEEKAKLKTEKKREKLVKKKIKLEKKLEQSQKNVEKSEKYIELLKRPVDRTGVDEGDI